MPLPSREVEDDDYLYAFGGRSLPTTLGQSLEATVEDPRLRPTELLTEQQQQEPGLFRQTTRGLSAASPIAGAYARAVEMFGNAFAPPPKPDDDVMLSPDEVKQEFGHLGVTFSQPTPRRVAEMTARRRQEDMHREEIIAASPQNIAAKGVRFGAAMLGAAVDPLNVASAFIPVLGEARMAQLTATVGVQGARLAQGAVAGATGALAVEPITYGLSRQLQLDYSMSDALLNVAVGTFLGAGLHVAGGAIADRFGRAPYIKTGEGVKGTDVPDMPLPEHVASASPEALEGAMRGSVAQFVEGRPVDVAPIFEVDGGLARAEPEGERNIGLLTPEQKAEAIAPHKQAIDRLAEPKSEWETPVATVEPKAEFTVADAQELDTSAIEAIEQAVVEARTPEVEAPAPAAKPKAKPRKGKPVSAYSYIEWLGGIRDDGGDLKAMDLPKRRFGNRGIINPKGMSIDDVRHSLIEAGYLRPDPEDAPPVSTINDVLEILGEHQAGRPTYSWHDAQAILDEEAKARAHENEVYKDMAEANEREAAEDQQRALDAIDYHITESGYPPLQNDAEKARAYELYQQGLEADDILERIAIEFEPEAPHPLAKEAIAEEEEIPFDAVVGGEARQGGEGVPKGRGGSKADAAAKARAAAQGRPAPSPLEDGEGKASLPEGVEPPPDFLDDFVASFREVRVKKRAALEEAEPLARALGTDAERLAEVIADMRASDGVDVYSVMDALEFAEVPGSKAKLAVQLMDWAEKNGVKIAPTEQLKRHLLKQGVKRDLAEQAAEDAYSFWDNHPDHATFEEAVADYARGEEPKVAKSLNDAARAARELFGEEGPEQGMLLSMREAQTDTPAFKAWFGDSKVVDAEGKPLRVYHGSARVDRVMEKSQFDPKRATSGPMAFFTDDPEIASSYTTKKADTSLPEDALEYKNWFLLKVPGRRKAWPITDVWYDLPEAKRKQIAELAPRVQRDDDGNIVLGAEDEKSGIGNYDWEIQQARGNHLKALVESWLSSGSLFNEEEVFFDVLKMVGLEGVEWNSPWKQVPGVVPVFLSIKKPLDTSAIPDSVVTALEKAVKGKRAPKYDRGVDLWDKRARDPREWMRTLKEDIASQKNSHAWTSIPDWVTDTLRAQGYDGIKDTGGKLGGQEHAVWIPFEPTQIKSATGNRGAFDPNNPDITMKAGGWDAIEGKTPRSASETEALAQAIIDRLPEGIKVKMGYSGEKLAKQTKSVSNQVEGGYSEAWSTIVVTTHALDPVKTLRHEEVHALRSLGLFDEKEWALLVERAGKLAPHVEARYRNWNARRFQGERLEDSLREEAVARMVEHYEAGARYGSAIDAIMERIVKFFEAIRNAARGLGFQTADDVIRRIETGEIGRRSKGAPQSRLGVDASMRGLFPSEMTPEGEQLLIPGTERKETKPKPQAKGNEMMRSEEPQLGPGPLFDDRQTDLIEQIRLKRADETVQKAEGLEASVMQAARCMSIKGLL